MRGHPGMKNVTHVRLTLIALVLLLAAIVVVIATAGMAEAQSPPGDEIVLVNAGREAVEWMKEGGFIARPICKCPIDNPFYGVR